MTQSRIGSLVEALLNVAVGYVINFAMNLVILNGVMGLGVTLMQNLWIGAMFTVVSVTRSYAIRRWFNARLHALALRVSGEKHGE